MELIYRVLWIFLGFTYVLFPQNIKYFHGYTTGESTKYGDNGWFSNEIDNGSLELLEISKKNQWMRRVKSRVLNGYFIVYYDGGLKKLAKYIKTTPYEYRYGEVIKPKGFQELSIEKILKYDSKGRVIESLDKSNNSVSNTIYGEYIIENNLSIDDKVINMSKTYYKEFCFDSKKLEEYTSSSCVDRVKLAVAMVISNEHKKIVSYVIYKYKPFRKVLTYDEDGKLHEYPTYGQENIKSMTKNYLDLNMTEEWKYIKKIDTLNGKGGVK